AGPRDASRSRPAECASCRRRPKRREGDPRGHQAPRSHRAAARPGARRRRTRVERFLRPTRLHHDPRGKAPRARQRRVLSGIRQAAAARRRLGDRCPPPAAGDGRRERERLARAAFKSFCRAFIDRTVLWWGSDQRIRQMVKLEGLEHLDAAGARKIILAPHFAGLDAAGIRLSMDRDLSSLYSHQKDPALDRLLLKSRTRFRPNVVSRQQGLRKVLRWIKSGIPFYYLPDLDFGRKGTIFVPFFGVPAATAVGLSYIARSTGARVVPCVARMLPGGGYVARLYPAWHDFPSGDEVADARRMMAFVEERVLEMPE